MAFMSRTLSELCKLLAFKSIHNSIYHLQTEGLVEQFNHTWKSTHSSFSMNDSPVGCIREAWEEEPSNSHSEIQYVLDLRAKLHMLGWLSMENLLQAQDKQSRLHNRGTQQFTLGDKVLVLLPTSNSKLLAKWQGSFVVTWRVWDLNYEVRITNRGGACQLYHFNLLKHWNEVTLVELTAAVSEEDLGPEAAIQVNLLVLVTR